MQRLTEQTVWDEITYLAFHLHWSLEELLDLPHRTRHRLVRTVAGLAARSEGSGDG